MSPISVTEDSCLTVCLFVSCVCVYLHEKLFQSNKRKPEREVMCDLSTCLLTEVEVDQVLSTYLVLIFVCQQETQPTLHLFASLSYLNRKLTAGRLVHSFVNITGSVATHDNCLEFPFYLSE